MHINYCKNVFKPVRKLTSVYSLYTRNLFFCTSLRYTVVKLDGVFIVIDGSYHRTIWSWFTDYMWKPETCIKCGHSLCCWYWRSLFLLQWVDTIQWLPCQSSWNFEQQVFFNWFFSWSTVTQPFGTICVSCSCLLQKFNNITSLLYTETYSIYTHCT